MRQPLNFTLYGNMKICLDTNCFIDAFNPNSKGYDAMQKILAFRKDGKLEIFVSLQNLFELAERKDEATELANSIDRLPHLSGLKVCFLV